MSQENLNEENIKEIIHDLDEIGLGSNLVVRLQFSVVPNEFLYTNINKFVSSYWERNSFHPETKVIYQAENVLNSDTSYQIIISGVQEDVRKIQREIPSFSWVDSESVFVISEEWN